MTDVCTKIKINIENIDKFSIGESCESVHQAHVILEEDIFETNKLRVYFDSKTYLDNKVMHWYAKEKSNFTIGKAIEFIKISNSKNIVSFDLSSSKCIRIKSNSSFVDSIHGKYFLIEFDAIRIIYKPVQHELDDNDKFDAYIYLNDSSKSIIDNFYWYDEFMSNKNVWEAKSRNNSNDFIKFGDIEINLGYDFTTKQKDDSITIYQEPRIWIKHKNLKEKELIKYQDLICSILSLFNQEYIYPILTRINNKKDTIVISKIPKDNKKTSLTGLRHLGFKGSLQKFLSEVNTELIFKNIAPFSKYVDKYILGIKLEGESRFMIFYNILEQIRNLFINPKTLKQEYNFSESNKQNDRFIRNKLREISEIVDESQVEDFKKNVIVHCNTIKYMPMKNQFKGLFDMFEINLNDSKIDFANIMSLRNKIFHGHSVDIDNRDLEDSNSELPVIIGKILLLMLGVKNLK